MGDTINTISVAYARVSKSAKYRAGMKHKNSKGIAKQNTHIDNSQIAINPHHVNGEESTQKNDNSEKKKKKKNKNKNKKEHSENKMVEVQDEETLEKCESQESS